MRAARGGGRSRRDLQTDMDNHGWVPSLTVPLRLSPMGMCTHRPQLLTQPESIIQLT